MADSKVSLLPNGALAGADLATGDKFYVVDVSATTAGSKYMLSSELAIGVFKAVTAPMLVSSGDGINFDTAAGDDADIDVLTLNVTGTPKLWWDESTDRFVATHGIEAKSFTNPDSGTSKGTSNEAFGAGALDAVATGGNYNTAVGYNALSTITTGDSCTAVGTGALGVCTGSENTALGESAGGATSTGVQNVFVGTNAGVYNTTGTGTVAIGYHAGYGSSGNSNLAKCVLIGWNAGAVIQTAAESTVAIGQGALSRLTTGTSNLAIGKESLMWVVTSIENVALGPHSGVYVVDGNYNTYLGYSAGACQTGGCNNVAVGRWALYGPYNAGAGPPQADVTITSDNVALGYYALSVCAGGDNNIAVGSEAGKAMTTGGTNILIGSKTGDNLTTGSGNILIGYDIAAAAVDSASTLNIGALIYGVQDAAVANKRLGFFDVTTPVAQAAHIADAAGGTEVATINAILVVLENLGFIKKT